MKRSLAISVPVSVLLVLVLTVFPLGEIIFQPSWGAMLVVFWCLYFAASLSLGSAFLLGILLDGFSGTLLGSHALSFCIVAYLTTLMNNRLVMFTWLQRALFVFVLIGISQIVLNWTLTLRGEAMSGFSYLYSAASSAVVWPLWSVVMKFMYPGREIND
ncbi:MAG: rod shape-determining protein MreD [Gammaproteobacteria bacterium]|nr:rod shape-determining protein MreD [Gammaproteobacteria bacterium]